MSKSDKEIAKKCLPEEEKKTDKASNQSDTSNENKKDVKSENVANASEPIEEEEEKEDLDEDEGNLVMTGSNYATVGKKSFLGHTCTLKTLLDDQVLVAEDGALSFEFMGKVFVGDLLSNGNIKWQETKQSFTTPSGWVNHCKKTMTDEQINKTVSAWSVIKYRGKRLDSYKLRWYRMKKKSLAEQTSNSMATQNAIAASFNASSLNNGFTGNFANGLNGQSKNSANHLFDKYVKSNTELLNSINPGLAALYNEANKSQLGYEEKHFNYRDYNVIEHSELPKKFVFNESDIKYLDCNQLVRCIPFRSLDRIQPFTISVSTNALLLMDYHCHLTSGEVVGYLAGTWDIGNHMLTIAQAFPCKAKFDDEKQAKIVEEEVKEQLRQRNLSLVGWYHNHGDKASHPSVKDIECQLEYQVTMKGNECDLAYIPCVGFICSPYFEQNVNGLSSFLAYWIMPPFELTSLEYGKPMQMFYQISRDCFLTQDLLLEMRLLAHFYMNEEDSIDFKKEISIRINSKPKTEGVDKEKPKIQIESVADKPTHTSNDDADIKKEPDSDEAENDKSKMSENGEESKQIEIKEESMETMETTETTEANSNAGEEEQKNVTKDNNESNCVPMVQFEKMIYWEKLKMSLQPNLPKDLQIGEDMNDQQVQLQQQALSHFWAFLKGLLLGSSSGSPSDEKTSE